MDKKETKGLIRLRKKSDKVPTYFCENCNCKRYSPCTCKKSEDKK
jgi:hypothetical protein